MNVPLLTDFWLTAESGGSIFKYIYHTKMIGNIERIIYEKSIALSIIGI